MDDDGSVVFKSLNARSWSCCYKEWEESCKVWKECIENIQPHLSGFVNEEWER